MIAKYIENEENRERFIISNHIQNRNYLEKREIYTLSNYSSDEINSSNDANNNNNNKKNDIIKSSSNVENQKMAFVSSLVSLQPCI